MPWYRPMRKNRLPTITITASAATITYVMRLKMMDCFHLDERMRINIIGFVCFHYVPSPSAPRQLTAESLSKSKTHLQILLASNTIIWKLAMGITKGEWFGEPQVPIHIDIDSTSKV